MGSGGTISRADGRFGAMNVDWLQSAAERFARPVPASELLGPGGRQAQTKKCPTGPGASGAGNGLDSLGAQFVVTVARQLTCWACPCAGRDASLRRFGVS